MKIVIQQNIFNDYFCKVDEFEYDVDRNFNSNFNLRIKKDVKISGKYISDRLPKALQILKKQTKILFKENFKSIWIKKKTVWRFYYWNN